MNFLKDITNKDKIKNKYTLSYEVVQNEKESIAKKVKKNKMRLRNLFMLILTLTILITSLIIFKNYKTENLYNKGIIKSAIITNIIHNNYKMNDVDGTFVNNFLIEYEFEFDKGIVNSFYEIHNKDYNKYFENRGIIKWHYGTNI
ncbi:hypothetical protein [Lutibacter citreus]|uniref:hypothetical protein n=1 Tax=Lutibacter citreus TaxID=2138210 RepID=UPI000DBE5169|nr:hypothetical protein [Lutibacter citreus]